MTFQLHNLSLETPFREVISKIYFLKIIQFHFGQINQVLFANTEVLSLVA